MTASATTEEPARPSPGSKRNDYLPTLDGWRAVAILGIFFDHGPLVSIGGFHLWWLQHGGFAGVDVFFAISGLLICWRLMREEEKRGQISLKNFYVRRAFRILPAAFLYLGTLAVLNALRVRFAAPRELLSAAFFLRNYSATIGAVHHFPYYTAHFWSLAVEEHFYLFLPAFLVLMPKKWRVPVLLGLSLVVIAHRQMLLLHRSWSEVSFHTDVRLDALLIPAALAIVAQQRAVRERFARGLRWWPVIAVVTVLVLTYAWTSYVALSSFLMAALVLGSMLNPENAFGRFLELPGVRFVGRLSYSLYLWQQLFITGPYNHENFRWLPNFPLQLLATFLCALASYYLVETPMIRLGHRLAPSPSLRAAVNG